MAAARAHPLAQEDILDFCVNAAYEHTRTWPDDYWPKDAAPPSQKAWTDSVASYARGRARMKRLARDVEDLTAKVPTGKGNQTYLRAILLAADHAAYHVGTNRRRAPGTRHLAGRLMRRSGPQPRRDPSTASTASQYEPDDLRGHSHACEREADFMATAAAAVEPCGACGLVPSQSPAIAATLRHRPARGVSLPADLASSPDRVLRGTPAGVQRQHAREEGARPSGRRRGARAPVRPRHRSGRRGIRQPQPARRMAVA